MITCVGLALVGLVAPGGCGSVYDMEADEPCRQAGFSIAARTETCTNDADLANQRYETFRDRYRCTIGKATELDFLCSRGILQTPCEDVLRLGDDYDAWLGRDLRCSQIFVRGDGGASGQAGAAGGGGASGGGGSAPVAVASQNAVCHGIHRAFNEWRVGCGFRDDPDFASFDALYTCEAAWSPPDDPPPQSLLVCETTLGAAVCPESELDFKGWLAQNPDCHAFFKEVAR
jgi:hypothetical protein